MNKTDLVVSSVPSTFDGKTPIVGIGASAGGLTALETLFEQLPHDTGAAFVVIQHLSPDYQSHMAELLGQRTKMQTVQLTDAETPSPNTVYLLPPARHVVWTDGMLELRDREHEGELNLPINKFLHSLAKASEQQIAAVILSGTGSDGSEGIQAIHDAGGFVLCQDEDSAQFNGMPLNAIKTSKVHLVAPVPELSEALALFVSGHSIDSVVDSTSPAIDRSQLESIYRLLESSCGVDFGQYKHGTFSRRLSRRMMLAGIEHLDQYIGRLEQTPFELSRLADDLMIGVTRFFRDPDGYQRLINRCIRPAISGKQNDDEFRVWVAGCATGQEAYSVAMLLFEEKRKSGNDVRIKVFASDVHPDAIRFAQRGVFPAESLLEIPAHLREQYVKETDDGFEINRLIRDAIIFARHDCLTDPPFTNLDLITCRNLLIYLVEEAQQRVLAMFTHSLRTRGILWLGPSETPGDSGSEFSALDKHWRLFQKERESQLPLDLKLRRRPRTNSTMSLRPRSSRAPSSALVLTYDKLLEKYAPPSVVVDESLQPLQIFGSIDRFCTTRAGRLSGTIDDIIVDELRGPLTLALQRIRLNQTTNETEAVAIGEEVVNIEVTVYSHPTISETHYLIAFLSSDSTGQPPTETHARVAHSPAHLSPTDLANATLPLYEERNRMLEMELDFTRENLQATIEEVETTNEELQSSNEELTSSNEELQSTNEELHSVNEELHTTNAESSRRLQLLTERTSDLETVMRDSHIGIILLDNDLNIRRTTPAAADLLGIGRRSANGDPISSHATAFKDVDLVDLATQVLEADEPFELETKDRFNEPVLIRASSYEDSTGVILTITNLKTVKDTADKLRKLTSIIADSTDAIIGVDLDYRITSWNRGAIRLFDNVVDASESIDLCSALPEDICNPCEILIRELEKKGEVPATEITTDLGDITRTLLVRATPVLDENERVTSAAITFYDVSKIKAAEEKLRLRNRAIEAATNGFIIVDALDDDMPIIYANEGFFDLTGFRPDDIVGRNCRFLQGNETDPAELRKLRNAIEQGEGTRVTLLNYRRDGTKFYNDLLISPVPDANGTITHFVGIQSDISGLVELNRSLQNSEAEYRSTFENAAVGIAHVGLNGNWLRVNRKLCQIVGYSLEELQQKNFQDITHPDDLDNDLNQFARMKRGEIDGYSMEKRYFHKNGNIIWINLTASLRRDSLGEAECCISIVEDITDRKLTEQKLVASRAIIAEVIETSDDPFISFDRDGGIQVANRAALELTNQTDGPSKTYQELFIHEPESPLTAALDRVRTSQRGESLEYLSRRLNRWYDARVFPVDGGAAVYMTDVTGRKQTETHLERARIAAEEASQAKSKFLTNMSHEIRSPMSAILGFSEISLRELRDGQPVDPEHLETVIRNGRFLLRIINDILDLSKVEAGKLEVRKSLFRLVPMLADIKELMRHRSESCGVPLAFDFDGPVVEQLESDRSRVEQILANLIGNALKFTPSGSVDVKISLVTQPDAFLLIAVADTGIGISASNLSRLFQTFSQVHDNKIVGVEGTGLGLVISKRLATSLGGDIDVTSVEGQGSTFTLRLPVHLESSTKLIEPKSDELKPVLTTSVDLTPVRGRILVADDARDIRMVTKRFLTRAGADVTEAVNGAEAVKAVRQAESEGKPFACILMDMQMPELDGRQATDQLRNEGYTMPIIALTAGATSEEIQDALASGCTEFISKPVNAPDLLARIADLT